MYVHYFVRDHHHHYTPPPFSFPPYDVWFPIIAIYTYNLSHPSRPARHTLFPDIYLFNTTHVQLSYHTTPLTTS